jgi:SAM-dependent methyltransferase
MNIQAKPNAGTYLAKYYGDDFYKDQMDASLRSALKYVELLTPLYEPDTVVDVGCGRGTWLKAFKEKGASRLVGYDGTWNTQENMVDQSITFYGVDLNNPITVSDSDRFDLAMSLEVAEHLALSSAKNFIQSLTNLSNVVLFGAAYTQQEGTNHINEQPHTYWAKIFSDFDYVPYDLFRPAVWGDEEIPFWYQQNTFLYVKNNSALVKVLQSSGHHPIKNIAFLDCVHPVLYESKIKKLETKALIRQLVVRSIPERLRPLAKKVRNLIA